MEAMLTSDSFVARNPLLGGTISRCFRSVRADSAMLSSETASLGSVGVTVVVACAAIVVCRLFGAVPTGTNAVDVGSIRMKVIASRIESSSAKQTTLPSTELVIRCTGDAIVQCCIVE